MSDKPFHKMTVDELRYAMNYWSLQVKNAPGWPSAYEAAKCCQQIESLAKTIHGAVIENPHPISYS